jgi:hypothetical protein
MYMILIPLPLIIMISEPEINITKQSRREYSEAPAYTYN